MLGFITLAYTIYQLPFIKDKYPWVDNHITAWQYEQKAKKFPPSDYAAKRYRAMAESLRKGNHDYEFESGPLPSLK